MAFIPKTKKRPAQNRSVRFDRPDRKSPEKISAKFSAKVATETNTKAITPGNTRFFVTTSLGMEETLSNELAALGAQNIDLSRGGVYFEGNFELCMRANLWLRTATRILMPLRDFSASTHVMLYDQIKRMKWENYLTPEKTLLVDCTISGEYGNEDIRNTKGLNHSHFVSLKIKDAIVDRCREKYGARPDVNKENPDIRIHAYIHGSRCTLSIDTSGKSLHERGYRDSKTLAPMKENLAAAIILLSEWDKKKTFYDPMCGSGTLAIEAAMIAQNIAPGMKREYFGFMGMPEFDEKLWQKIKLEARNGELKNSPAHIFAGDENPKTLEAAKRNAKNAGVSNSIRFYVSEFSDAKAPTQTAGHLIMNPPYGERMGDKSEIFNEYKKIGDIFKNHYKGWTAFVFTGNLEAGKHVGLRTSRKIPLFNGPIECRLLKFDLY